MFWMTDTKKKIDYYTHRIKNKFHIQAPISVVDHLKIDELMFGIIKFYIKDKYHSIVDPTCGITNRQFSKLLDILEEWGINYYACDANPENWSGNTCNIFNPKTLPKGEVWIYDPPYVPQTKHDPRAADYGVDSEQTIETIKNYYSPIVFNNMIHRGAKLIIVKGADFFFPQKSNNLYLFLKNIIQIPEELRPTNIIIYRYRNHNDLLANIRMWKTMQKHGYTRSIIVHTYYLFLEKR